MHSIVGRSSTGATDLIFVKTGAPADAVIPPNLNGNSFVSLTDGATTLTPGVDYMIHSSVLTVKASALSAYASGAYGEKTVLKVSFSAGQPWKLRVRHQTAPILSDASGTKTGSLVIPAAFNGDLVATMEAKYGATTPLRSLPPSRPPAPPHSPSAARICPRRRSGARRLHRPRAGQGLRRRHRPRRSLPRA